MEPQAVIADQLGRLMAMAPSGFAMAFHVRFTTPTFLFQTYPKEWIDYYSRNGLVMRDPTVLWGFENTGMVRWSDLLPRDGDQIIAKAQAYGMQFGFTYVIEIDNSRSLTSFTRGDRDFSDAEIAEISGMVDLLHNETLTTQTLTDSTRAALRGLSIRFTHP